MTNEPRYDLRRPPVMLMNRIVEFTCVECGRMGYGPPNARVHPGACFVAHKKKIAARTIARSKRLRQMAAEAC